MDSISPSKRGKLKGKQALKVSIKLAAPIAGPLKTAYLPAVLQHERDLVASEKKYRDLVELAHEGITTADAQDNLTFVNRQFAQSLGYSVDEMLGKSLYSFATKESTRRLKSQTLKRMKGLKSRYEVTMVHKDGSPMNFWLSASPLFDEHKNFVGSTGVYTDITEKKQVEHKLSKRVRQINALYRVYSHARMQRSFSSVLKGIVDELVTAFPENQLVQAHIMLDGKSYSSSNKPKQMAHKIEIPLIIGGVERGKMVVGYSKQLPGLTLRDEKELCRNVAQILCKHMYAREIMNRHKEIVSKAFTALIIIHKGNIQYANPRFYSLFRVKQGDAIGQRISRFLPYLNLGARQVDGKVREYVGKRVKGNDLDLAVTMLNIAHEGHPSILIRANDITALKHAQARLKNFNQELRYQVREKTRHLRQANQRLQSLNALKDEFIAITSHELRSPLTSIRGYLSMLAEDGALDQLKEPQREYLMRAHSTADALNHLVNNLLDVSRIDMGRFELQIQQIDVVRLLRGIVDSLAFQAIEKKLILKFRNDCKQVSLIAPIDGIRISQVLRNLLDNSIKFSKRGKKILVTIKCSEKRFRITVADQGVGIPKARLNEVFDKFMQVKNIQTKYRGGAGLGLFISKRIVELHGGTIEADRNSDGGTTVSIDLPLNLQSDGKK